MISLIKDKILCRTLEHGNTVNKAWKSTFGMTTIFNLLCMYWWLFESKLSNWDSLLNKTRYHSFSVRFLCDLAYLSLFSPHWSKGRARPCCFNSHILSSELSVWNIMPHISLIYINIIYIFLVLEYMQMSYSEKPQAAVTCYWIQQ